MSLGDQEACVTISSPSSPFLFHSFLSCFALLVILLTATSWDITIQKRPKALAHSASIPLSFNHSQWGSPRGSDYNKVTAASAMLINVGGLKEEAGGKRKKVPMPASPYIIILNRLAGRLSQTDISAADTSGTGSPSQTHSKSDVFA